MKGMTNAQCLAIPHTLPRSGARTIPIQVLPEWLHAVGVFNVGTEITETAAKPLEF